MPEVVLRRDRSQGSTYGLASLEGEGLPVPPTLREQQSYSRTHLVPPLPQRLASGEAPVPEVPPVGEGLPSGEAPVPEVPPVGEGLPSGEAPVPEVPPVPAVSE